MTDPDYKEILFKIRPTNKDLWSVSFAVALFGVFLVLSLFDIFGTKSEIVAMVTGLFAASWVGRFAETISVRKKIDNALEEKW